MSINDSKSTEFSKLRVSIRISISSLTSSYNPVIALKDSNSYKHGFMSPKELYCENLALNSCVEGRGSEEFRLGRTSVKLEFLDVTIERSDNKLTESILCTTYLVPDSLRGATNAFACISTSMPTLAAITSWS